MVSCKPLRQTISLLSMCVLVLTFLTSFSTVNLNAQAPDCSKICYEYGTVSSGGSICVGSKGAVKPNSTVTITDSKGNKTSTTSRADGSFGASAATLEASIGSTVTITVNGKSCTTTVKRPNTCGNFYCYQYPPDRLNQTMTELQQMSLESYEAFCTGNYDVVPSLADEMQSRLNKIQAILDNTRQLAIDLQLSGQPNNGGGAGPDCSKICYDRGTVATGGPICFGGKGAVPGNSTVEITDARGNTTTTTSNADGSFDAKCNNHVVRVGDRITVKVNGKTCTVIAQRPGACRNAFTNNNGNNGGVGNTGGSNPNNPAGQAAGPDCSKICYDRGTVATGGPICFGGKGAVPGNSTVEITDARGNTTTTTSNADGSFDAKCNNHVVRVGDRITVKVNGKTCIVIAQRPGACRNAFSNNNGNNGGVGNTGGSNPNNPAGQAAGPDCSKICYDRGTVATGGPICFGGKGAVPGNSTVEITDARGNTTTTTSNADGSFDAKCNNHVVRVGDRITIKVNGKTCTVIAQRPGACRNAFSNNNGNNGGINPNNPAGQAGDPDCTKICYDRGTVATGGPICAGLPGAVPPNSTVEIIDSHGNITTTKSSANGAFGAKCNNHVVNVGDKITIRVNGKVCFDIVLNSWACNRPEAYLETANAGGGDAPNNPNNPAGLDCTKICYERGTVATGGPICIGQKGAVPPNATIMIRDSRGVVTTCRSNADGSFATACPNHNGQVGSTVTIIVHGKTCTVRVQPVGGCK